MNQLCINFVSKLIQSWFAFWLMQSWYRVDTKLMQRRWKVEPQLCFYFESIWFKLCINIALELKQKWHNFIDTKLIQSWHKVDAKIIKSWYEVDTELGISFASTSCQVSIILYQSWYKVDSQHFNFGSATYGTLVVPRKVALRCQILQGHVRNLSSARCGS
jgi:hypothetical protein